MSHNNAPSSEKSGAKDSAKEESGPGETVVDESVDARGLNCPLPILRARKALNKMQAGQVLEVIATDPGTVMDFDAFCKQSGNKLLHQSENAGEFRFLLQKV